MNNKNHSHIDIIWLITNGGMKKMKFNIITLCGSTRFKEDFEQIQRELTLQGNIVFSPGIFSHSEKDSEEWLDNNTKVMLDDLHRQKIDMSDEIFVINRGGYIGESTRLEIEYANSRNMPVRYMEDVEKMSYQSDNEHDYWLYHASCLGLKCILTKMLLSRRNRVKYKIVVEDKNVTKEGGLDVKFSIYRRFNKRRLCTTNYYTFTPEELEEYSMDGMITKETVKKVIRRNKKWKKL